MAHKINGKPVDNLIIKQKPNGEYEITYTEKFNLITAPHHQIHSKLKKRNIRAHIFKYIEKNFISILLFDITLAHQVLTILQVPEGCYEINKENKTIIIQLKKNKKYNTKFNKIP